MTIAAGTRLGPYEIVSRVGAGGMGEVFRARDTRLDRAVAIKVLSREFASNGALKQRFEREARAISQLNHAHICTVHDVGSHDGVDFLVMELIDGESLADRLARGPLPPADVLRYGAEIADALHAAHRVGIVHRDLKPGNVMITRAGAKLLDFGLAKFGAAVLSPDAPTEQQKPLTAEGTIVGTFQYMAPEQLEGLEADVRTDIFALGCVLYEMLTGRRAFDGRTRTSLVAAIVAGNPVPVQSLQPLTPSALEHVISVCLRKERDERWQSAHDVAEELRWISVAPQREPGADVSKRRFRIAAAAALLAGAVVGALLFALFRRTTPRPPVYASIAEPRGVEMGIIGERRSVVSPGGDLLAFIGKEADGTLRIWIRAFASGHVRPLSGTEGAYHIFWSPDSRWLGFFAAGKLKKVPLDGSPPISLCDVGSNPRGGAWSPDGVILFAPSSLSPLHRISASGGKAEPVTVLDTTRQEDTHRWPRFLPDGKSFLFLAAANTGSEHEADAVYGATLGSPGRKLILRTRFHVEYVDGHLLFIRGTSLFAQKFDADRMELRGEAFELAKNVLLEPAYLTAAFTAGGRQLLYVTGKEERKIEFVMTDAAGKELGAVLPPGSYDTWDVSPRGDRLAITVNASSGDDVWIHDLTRGTRTPVTTGGSGSEPVWSPDSSTIAYVGRARTLYRKNVDADTSPEPIWRSDGWAGPSDWSPGGGHLALTTFSPKSATDYDVYVLPLDGTRTAVPVANTAAEEFAGFFSPDGRWLTYFSDASGKSELYAVSFPDGRRKQQISVGGSIGMVWKSPTELLYMQEGGAVVAVTVGEDNGRLTVSTPRPVFVEPRLSGFHAMPDSRLLLSRRAGEWVPPEQVLVTNWASLLEPHRQ